MGLKYLAPPPSVFPLGSGHTDPGIPTAIISGNRLQLTFDIGAGDAFRQWQNPGTMTGVFSYFLDA